VSEPGRILILDDDREFVGIYKELLESQGVEVAVAYTAEDALRTSRPMGPRWTSSCSIRG
jgi:ActR/RegA family two-component response regulator